MSLFTDRQTGFGFPPFFINALLLFQDSIQGTTLHVVVMSSQAPLFGTVSQTFLVCITLIVLESTSQVFWKMSLTFFSWSDCGSGFCEEHHRCEVFFSSHSIRGFWYQCDLPPRSLIKLSLLIKVVFARFPHSKGTISQFLHYIL